MAVLLAGKINPMQKHVSELSVKTDCHEQAPSLHMTKHGDDQLCASQSVSSSVCRRAVLTVKMRCTRSEKLEQFFPSLPVHPGEKLYSVAVFVRSA